MLLALFVRVYAGMSLDMLFDKNLVWTCSLLMYLQPNQTFSNDYEICKMYDVIIGKNRYFNYAFEIYFGMMNIVN